MEKVSMHGDLVLSLGLVLMITVQPKGAMGGACGYGNLYTDGYEIKTAVLSTALFDDGKSCGGSYQIVCDAIQVHQWCLKGTFITITATNFCPPNYALPSDNGGWCNPPRPRLDMSQPAFETIAKVGCRRDGGIRFTFNRRDYFELFLISNVGGAGEISNVWLKGSKMNEWETMSRNWEANWQSLSYLNPEPVLQTRGQQWTNRHSP